MAASNSCSREITEIHLLLRGEVGARCQDDCEDDYISRFKAENLIAITIPILEIKYVNSEVLLEKITSVARRKDNPSRGLIITSPRAVGALKKALRMINDEDRSSIISKFNPDLVYVVGEKSAKLCQAQLGLECNRESIKSGNVRNLIKIIKGYCTTLSSVVLIYPKQIDGGNIEESFLDVDNYKVESLVAYECNVIETLESVILERLRGLRVTTGRKLNLNVIFFSPHSLEGFLRINQTLFLEKIRDVYPGSDISIRYSSIGSTTAAAMRKNNLQIFSVAESPNPNSLVKSILDANNTILDSKEEPSG